MFKDKFKRPNSLRCSGNLIVSSAKSNYSKRIKINHFEYPQEEKPDESAKVAKLWDRIIFSQKHKKVNEDKRVKFDYCVDNPGFDKAEYDLYGFFKEDCIKEHIFPALTYEQKVFRLMFFDAKNVPENNRKRVYSFFCKNQTRRADPLDRQHYETTRELEKSYTAVNKVFSWSFGSIKGNLRDGDYNRILFEEVLMRPPDRIGKWPIVSVFGIIEGHGGPLCMDIFYSRFLDEVSK